MIERDIVIDDATGKTATVYTQPDQKIRAAVLYLHGGALIYGSRKDLPELHLEKFTSAGFAVVAVDYPLFPSVFINEIITDVKNSIEWYLRNRISLFGSALPYFILGRSAGAYLCLMMMQENISEEPAGILSYYGYGILTPGWIDKPNSFYNKYSKMPTALVDGLSKNLHYSLPIASGFGAYVSLRQRGAWGAFPCGYGAASISLKQYTPSGKERIFLCHCTGDNDVPFSEFLSLKQMFPNSVSLCVPGSAHDFDSDTTSEYTSKLLESSIEFINTCIENIKKEKQ